jgi:hypothetical protein
LSFFIEEPKSNHFAGKIEKFFASLSRSAGGFFFGPNPTCVAEKCTAFPTEHKRGVLAICFDLLSGVSGDEALT